MIYREFWINRIKSAWKEVPIVWLCGVRRSGKTTLAKSIGDENSIFVNGDNPMTEQMVADPMVFYRSCEKSVVIFDEIHQLRDPSRLLKIGADEFPHLKILATGSSTLAASRKFLDTLTGRKRTIHLLPVLWSELGSFEVSLDRRLYHGGIPNHLLASFKSDSSFREWLDSFFARDIQRLFGFRDFNRFNSLFEYLLRQSGGLLEMSKVARFAGISRPTVESHLQALEITHAITLVRPFHGGGQKEITKMSKSYAFDTGFVSFARGWNPLRPEDFGLLWEHLVLEYLLAYFPDQPIRYWRDQQGHELDFILTRDRDHVDVIECKWNPSAFDDSSLQIFRKHYPRGNNYVVSPSGNVPFVREYRHLKVTTCTPDGLIPV